MPAREKSRFIGSLLGVAFGDVLGAAVEMQNRPQILRRYPQMLRDFQATERGFGCYTDDTEMTLALARSILRLGEVDGADCAAAYVDHFTAERGYGRSAQQVLAALGQGADWRATGRLLFAEGSFGNGAAMRIAPVGLVYGHLDAAALSEKVRGAVWMTHCHREAIEAALLQARAIGLLRQAGAPPEGGAVVAELMDYLVDSVLQESLVQVARLLDEQAPAEVVSARFGCGVRSRASWPPALWAALRFVDDPEEAIVQAVNLGGDTDTIGAMTGALVGALHGDTWFPARWFRHLENGPDGRDAIIATAEALATFSNP